MFATTKHRLGSSPPAVRSVARPWAAGGRSDRARAARGSRSSNPPARQAARGRACDIMPPMPASAGHGRRTAALAAPASRRSVGGSGRRRRCRRRPGAWLRPAWWPTPRAPGFSATRWRSTQPFGPTVGERGGEGRGQDRSRRRRGSARRARAPRTGRGRPARPAVRRVPRARPTRRSRRAISQLTGPVRLQHPHDLAEVDLREVELRRGRSLRPAPNRKPGKPGTGCLAPPWPEEFGSRALRGLQVETDRPRGQCMRVHSVAVTGASGLVGRHLLPVLAAHPDVERVLGLDVREPERPPAVGRVRPGRHRRHRAEAAARGHRRRRAPRRCRRPRARRRAHGAGQRRGHAPRARRRRVGRRAAGRAHLERHRLRRVGEQPGAAHRGRRPAAQPRLLARGAGRRGRAAARRVAGDHPEVTITTLRSAPVVGPGAERLPARILLGRPPLRVRGAALPVQVVHVDDLVAALALVATQDLPGVVQRRRRRLARRRRGPRRSSTAPASRRCRPRCSSAARSAPGSSAWATSRPAWCPTSTHPWVIANDKLRAAGWAPVHDERRTRSPRRWRRSRPRLPSRSCTRGWWLRRGAAA